LCRRCPKHPPSLRSPHIHTLVAGGYPTLENYRELKTQKFRQHKYARDRLYPPLRFLLPGARAHDSKKKKQELAEMVSPVVPPWGPNVDPRKPFQAQSAHRYANHVHGNPTRDDHSAFADFRPSPGARTHPRHPLRPHTALQHQSRLPLYRVFHLRAPNPFWGGRVRSASGARLQCESGTAADVGARS